MGQQPIPGSARVRAPQTRVVADADPTDAVEVTILVRPKPSGASLGGLATLGSRLPHRRRHLSHEEFERKHGADPRDLARVERFAGRAGLDVTGRDAAARTVTVKGTVRALERAFGVDLAIHRAADASYRGHDGAIHVPEDLAATVRAVFGLDERRVVQPHFRLAPKPVARYTPPQLADRYRFPKGDGAGECIGIVEGAGGYRLADLQTYFGALHLPTPSITAVPVGGGTNRPTGKPSGPDAEVMMDIEIAAAVAPAARIAVYFAKDSDSGMALALSRAVHDRVNKPSVISFSWGGVEQDWPGQTIQAVNRTLQEASRLGITVCVSSGDAGSGTPPEVQFPASSPFALACGGTSLTGSSESVWNDLAQKRGASGGGVSVRFPLPTWQKNAKVPLSPGKKAGRGVPDVAAHADPDHGYHIRVDGVNYVGGGTSAATPLWAGLIARLNQLLGTRVGYLNPLLYLEASRSGILRGITKGSNGAYQAGRGWNACTGLGTPNGEQLLKALRGPHH